MTRYFPMSCQKLPRLEGRRGELKSRNRTGLSCRFAANVAGAVTAPRADVDAAWLHGLRCLALEVNGEQSVGQACSGHLYVLGEFEATTEGADGNAPVQILTLWFQRPFATDDEQVRLVITVRSATLKPATTVVIG